MRRMQRFLCAVLTACLVSVLAYAPAVTAQRGTITCESYKNDYHHCYADTRGRVTLIRKLSSKDCVQGRSWGYDNTGVWVDRGCRAEFEYGRDRPAGAVGGAVSLAVIISNRRNKEDYDKLSDADKAVYNRGWDLGSRDAGEGRNSDYRRYRSEYLNSRESVFKSGYKEGYRYGRNRRGGR